MFVIFNKTNSILSWRATTMENLSLRDTVRLAILAALEENARNQRRELAELSSTIEALEAKFSERCAEALQAQGDASDALIAECRVLADQIVELRASERALIERFNQENQQLELMNMCADQL